MTQHFAAEWVSKTSASLWIKGKRPKRPFKKTPEFHYKYNKLRIPLGKRGGQKYGPHSRVFCGNVRGMLASPQRFISVPKSRNATYIPPTTFFGLPDPEK